MASKKGSKKTEEKVEEAVVEEKVEEVPVEEPAPAPAKVEKKAKKSKAEMPDHVGYSKTTAEFVEEVHQALLGRSATEHEVEIMCGLVTRLGLPLPEIVRQVKMSGEYQATLPLIEV